MLQIGVDINPDIFNELKIQNSKNKKELIELIINNMSLKR